MNGQNFLWRSSFGALAIVLSFPAHAQDASSDATQAAADRAGALEEIVVTAQKRAENVQDVPIAITAFTAAAISEKGVTTVQGLGNLAPNVTLDAGSPFSGSSSVLTAFIRGIGQDDFAFNLDPGVGIYLDGVYLARTIGANTDLLDVERIEVLKGPQGTLFGRNSIGGAVSIVTRAPGKDFSFRGEAIGGRYNRFDVRGSVDIPLVADTLLSNVTFAKTSREGYSKRIAFPSAGFVIEPLSAFPRSGLDTHDREGGEHSWTVRGKLLWHASDRLDATLTADYQRQNQPGTPNTLLKTNAALGTIASLYNACVNAPLAVLPAVPGANLQALCGGARSYGTGGPIGGVNADANPNNNRLTYDDRFVTGDKDTNYGTAPNFSKLTNWGINGTLVYDLADDMHLKSITAYRKIHWAAGTDSDASPIGMQDVGFLSNQWQFSQELQLTGNALDDRLDYVFGAYYFKEKGNIHDIIILGQGLTIPDGNNLLQTESYAAYTHLNYRFSDTFSVTLGGRYTEERKRFEGTQRDSNGIGYKIGLGLQLDQITQADRIAAGFPDPNDPLRLYPAGVNHKKFSNFSPRIGAELRPTDDVMVYGSFAKGYKTGGWTTRLTAPELVAPDFDEEKANSYELGVKSELFDRRLRLNTAGFFTQYRGIQLNQLVGVSPTVRNAGDAEIYGAELEWQAAFSEAFLVSGAVGYIHDRYTHKDPGTAAGSQLPKTPHWKVNVSPRYSMALGNGGKVITNVDYTYTSSLFNDTENSPIIKRGSVNMLNASIAYDEPNDHWSLTVGGTNLLNERYIVTGQNQTGVGFASATYSRPAEWYVKFGVKF